MQLSCRASEGQDHEASQELIAEDEAGYVREKYLNFDAAAEEVICRDEGHRHLSELVRWSLVDCQPFGRQWQVSPAGQPRRCVALQLLPRRGSLRAGSAPAS